MRLKTVFYLSLVLVPAFFLGRHLLLIRYGYCYETGKFFSELDYQSLEDQAIERVWEGLRPGNDNISWNGINYYDPIIPYKDIETFKKINPDCCYFTQEQLHPAVEKTVFSGKVYGYIVLKYWVFRTYSQKTPEELRYLYPPAKKRRRSVCFKHLRYFPSFFRLLLGDDYVIFANN